MENRASNIAIRNLGRALSRGELRRSTVGCRIETLLRRRVEQVNAISAKAGSHELLLDDRRFRRDEDPKIEIRDVHVEPAAKRTAFGWARIAPSG